VKRKAIKQISIQKLSLALCLFALPALAPKIALADACSNVDKYTTQVNQAQAVIDDPNASTGDKAVAQSALIRAKSSQTSEAQKCDAARNREDSQKESETACTARQQKYAADNNGGVMWKWNDRTKQCDNLSDTKALTSSGDCNAADVFAGSLKGEKCKAAMQKVDDVKSRNSALNDTSLALAQGYGMMQANMATGQQTDAQSRQANVMQMLAITKLATGGAQLEGAMELKNAASGAQSANSTISDAQKNLAQICQTQNQTDDQTCFFQNAAKVGIEPSQSQYANFERMKTAARQSQDQADAANQLAKSSMITGLADTLVGLQALKMAQAAKQNANGLGVMPGVAPPPPPPSYAFAGASTGAPPALGQSAPAAPQDFGSPNSGGLNLGNQQFGPMRGGLMQGHSYGSNTFKAASSGISGGGGGGGGGGFAGLKNPGGGGKNSAKRGPANTGEYAMGASPTGMKGSGGNDKNGAPGTNPLAEMLAKMFPQDKDGKPVVDTRALASTQEAPAEGQDQGSDLVASEASIFEQVSAKYHQLSGSGRI
jgi:chemotaxis protein histidine kinase CheA